MRKYIVILTILLLSSTAAMAAPRTTTQMQAAALQAINKHRASRHLAPRNEPLKVLRNSAQLQVIGYESGGFAVVAVDDLLPAVMGVSTARHSNGSNPNFEWWLQATEAAAASIASSQAPMQVTMPDPALYPEEVQPLVTTKWYQEKPYNNMCPAFNASANCLTGCVATATAQILNYHKSPEHGFGHRTIYYPHANTSGQPVTADFEEDYYDWGNMLDIYKEGEYNDEQANAVALLMRDCGVAADMEYGGPNEGSGAYSQDAAYGLRKYFGFEDAQMLSRISYSESDWMNIIYHELSENGPVYYGGADIFMGGHAFLFDGYNAEGQVSVNWGWAGDDDGYFYVSQLNPTPYNFSFGQDMIVGIKSANHKMFRSEEVKVTTGGQLKEMLEDDSDDRAIASLTIEGPLNMDDLLYLRHLSGWNAEGEPTDGALRQLDLTKARLEGNSLPDSIFKDCATLRRVRLPETIATIGAKAFMGCTALAELRLTCKTVPRLTANDAFEGLPFGKSKLYVLKGLKQTYAHTEPWSAFGSNNIFEIGTSLKVRNTVRNYGEENPEFKFTVNGSDRVVGSPFLTCEATPTSPAGRYPIHISAGTMTNAEAFNFIDGYLIVQKIDAKAFVETAERFEGEENPTFTLRYEGLIKKEKTPAWIEGPVFVTSATPLSRPGEYTVYVESGEAESYNMVFLPGKLIVKENPIPNGISEVNTNSDAPAFNLQGQRISQPTKGIYIKNGKKVSIR